MTKPPYQITPEILRQVASISEKIGQINARFLDKPSPQLRKKNRIQTIHASLSIEGNTLSEEQITAILEEKRVVGPAKDVSEVLNAIEVYNQIKSFQPTERQSFLRAHKILMKGLISNAGKYRTGGVGILAGKNITHVAPPAENVRFLMNNLFKYLKSKEELALIKSCVFHYELEFIHPFTDGNGRMGRLWQTLILMQTYPVFEFIPFENIIRKTQSAYYKALAQSDKAAESTPFISYMLGVIDESLSETFTLNNRKLNTEERLYYFSEFIEGTFTRKAYMNVFKEISSATASRDLKLGVELGLFLKKGDKKNTLYTLKK